MCGMPATTRIPSGFACSGCALDAFLSASDQGDTSWIPKLLDPPEPRTPVRRVERLRTEETSSGVK